MVKEEMEGEKKKKKNEREKEVREKKKEIAKVILVIYHDCCWPLRRDRGWHHCRQQSYHNLMNQMQ